MTLELDPGTQAPHHLPHPWNIGPPRCPPWEPFSRPAWSEQCADETPWQDLGLSSVKASAQTLRFGWTAGRGTGLGLHKTCLLLSGRQLQPEEPDAETEEDHSVTEGPVDEIIRPRPQGSSPVYECVTEGASFGLPEDTPGRQGSSGRRRSWWKRDSGDSQTFSRMSHPEEATDVTLKTEVEAGVSGYSVTGGGDQGIFVKHVLKDSSAAKLFSLREGDQLLSATVFFDDIKYEDALKILQYSEPYKVQFKVRRKVPARGAAERAAGGAQRAPKTTKQQGKDVTDGGTDTPTKMMEGDGDQERLITKPRDGRGRRPQKDRLSWPKFQSIKNKRGRGPRRSHSSSEAYEQGKAPAVGPTSSDTEAEFPADEQEQEAGTGSRRRSRFLNLKFKVGSGKGPSLAGQPGTGSKSGAVHPGVLEEAGSWDDNQEGAWAGTRITKDDRTAEAQWRTPALRVQWPTEPALSCKGALGGEADMAHRPQRETMGGKVQEDTVPQGDPRAGPDPGQSRGRPREGMQRLEMGTATLPLQDTAGEGHKQGRHADFQIRILNLKTPKFGFSKEHVLETEGDVAVLELGMNEEKSATQAVKKGDETTETKRDRDLAGYRPDQDEVTAENDMAGLKEGETKDIDKDMEGKEEKMKMLNFKMPSFGWSPVKDTKAVTETQKKDTERENQRHRQAKEEKLQIDSQRSEKDEGERWRRSSKTKKEREKGERKERDHFLGDKEEAARDSKFKMPKFKMPSFGVSVPSKDLGTSVDIPVPKVTGEATLPSLGGEIPAPEGSVQLPSAEIELPGGKVEVGLPEGDVSLVELKDKAEGTRLKGHLPKVQMPGIKMPKVDIKGPHVDIKGPHVDITGPKLDLKGAKGEVATPDVAVSLPSVEVDIQAPGTKIEDDIALGDKEAGTRDSKFKMPKFKMPSFGVSVPSKSTDASVDMSGPQVKADVRLPSFQADVKTTDLSIDLPSTDVDVKTSELGVKLPEGHVPEGELQEPAAGAGLKGHMPKVHMPSIKMPKVDFKGPHVDIRGPKLDLKGAKGEVASPDVVVSLPSVEVDSQAPEAKLEGDIALGDKEATTRDSKFKMPKFKMPSFGVTMPSKDLRTTVEMPVPKVTGEAPLPSLGGEIPAPEGSVQLPSAEIELPGGKVEVGLPEGDVSLVELKDKAQGTRLKGHLPKVQMPGIKMPKVDIKGPHVDIKGPHVDITGPKLGLKDAKGEVATPDVAVSLPSVEVDIQATGAKIEDDIDLGDKEAAARDSKFKMPKFKMPSFGMSVPSKSTDASVDVSGPQVQADVSLPSYQVDVKTGDLSIDLPSADVYVKTSDLGVKLPEGHVPEGELQEPAAGAGLKAHLPKVHMPSIKTPKVDLKGPQVDITGPKLDLKGAKGEVASPDVAVSVPSVEVDIQAPEAKLEGDIALGDKEAATRDSKFKMPKFKMPSFGVSAPSKDLRTSMDVPVPKVTGEAPLPSLGGEIRAPEGSVQLPSAEIELPGGKVEVGLPEGDVSLVELKDKAEGTRLKGHLPKVQMPGIKMPKVDIKGPHVDIKGPHVDITGPKLGLKDAKGEVANPDVAVSLPSVEVDIQAPGAKIEDDIALGEKEEAARDSKFKMPKFKMPSFGMSVPRKSTDASVDVSGPQVQSDVCLPSFQADVKTSDLSIDLPSAEVDVKTGDLGVKLPEGHVPEGELQEPAAGAGLKGHLPKVHMPSIKMPKVDLKGPQVDITGPKLDLKGVKGQATAPDMAVSLPSIEVDIQASDTKLEGDIALGDKEVAARDSKFKMPKFKRPSFGVSAPSKDLGTSVDVPVPKVTGEATLPSLGGEIRTPEGSVQVPSAEIELPGGKVEVGLPEGDVSLVELKDKAEGTRLKGHLPKVQMPGIKMPKVDIKGPHVDIKGPHVDIRGPKLGLKGAKGEAAAPDMAVSLPSVEVDIQAPGTKLEGDIALGDKEVAARDSKFKMPKFKRPSFGVSAPSKDLGTSVDVPVPKVTGEAPLPSLGGEIRTPEGSVQLPSAEIELPGGEVEVGLPEGDVSLVELKGKAEGARFKGHLPKVQMPGIKMPKVDVKGPHVDITEPKLDLKGAKGEVVAPDVAVSLPSVEVDIQATGAKVEDDIALGDKEAAARDSKFKMPKFKMPSFGMSVPSKSTDASVDVSGPQVQADVRLPSFQADVKTSDLRIDLPSTNVDVKTGELVVKLPEGHVPEGELQDPAAEAGLKGHMPKVQVPSIKMPKVDFKGPHVDIRGPKMDLKGAKGEVAAADVAVSLPSVEVDIQAPGAKIEDDIALGEKEEAARDSKFKMPKFKMPSFGMSAPSKSTDASVDVSGPQVQADVRLPSFQADVKTSDLSIDLPSTDVDVKSGELGVKLPEGHVPEGELQEPAAGAGLKGHLPKVHMPSIKMPKVDLKGPQVDITGPKLDLKGAKGQEAAPDMAVSLPSVEVDIQAPGTKLEGDIALGDKEASARDSKFKMPKFKMPSFGMSAPIKDLGTSVDVPVPKVTGEATLPSLGGEIPAPEGSVQLPSAEIELPGGEVEVGLPEGDVRLGKLKGKAEGTRLKGHLPKVQVPTIKMPKVDFKGPHEDIRGPKLDLKGAKGEVASPDVAVSLPSVEVDIQAPEAKLEGDIALGDMEAATRDSKFEMPKFKMPSFGVSAPSKDLRTSMDVPVPKVTGEATLPSLGGEIPAPEGSVQLPSAEIELPGGKVEVGLPEGDVSLVELKGKAQGTRLKGHLPKVQMPGIKMPKVDIKGPHVDIKGPHVDITGPKLDLKDAKGEVATPNVAVSLPSVEVDIQAPGAKIEDDNALGEKEEAARDSKFKMPKFKMPSFGMSVPSKSTDASVDVSGPQVQADVSLPSFQVDVKTSELSIDLPSTDVDVKSGELDVNLPEGHVPEGELQEPAAGAGLKGHLPKVHMPSIKMPKVDLKGLQVDITGPKLDREGAKVQAAAPDMAVSLPSVEVDIQAPGTKLEGDIALGDKEVAARDSKFKMPKFKRPSFGVSAPSKDLGTSVDVPVPKVTGEAPLPSLGGEIRTPEGSVQLPSAEIELPGGEVEVGLPEGDVSLVELKGKAEGARFKGHLPKVQMPGIKMPKVDVKGPHVDITEPKLDLKGAKGEVVAPDVAVSLPSVEVDIQATGAKVEDDIALGDKEAAARDSKFKMPKFKMPSFGVSAPSKDLGTSVDVPVPKVTGEATLLSLGVEIRAPEGSVQLPSAEIELPGGEVEVGLPESDVRLVELKDKAEGARFKGHLPKVQMPGIKIPKVDIKGPHVDIKSPHVDFTGPKLDLKGAKGEVAAPDVAVSLPSVEVDIQAPGAKLEGDIALGDKEAATRDSKFEMPKFKMPSFSVSVPRKDFGTSVDVPVPKVTGEATLPCLRGEIRAPDGSVQLPSAEIELPGRELHVGLPEGEVRLGELKDKAEGARFKGHLPKVQMPSIKMPKVDFKGPQVDITGPKLDLKGSKGEVATPDVAVSLPRVEVDIQAPGAKMEDDIDLGDKEAAARDSKFKMPKFKKPSFGVSAPSKSTDTSVDVPGPQVQADVSLPSFQVDVKTSHLSIDLPSADVDVQTSELGVKLPEGHVPEGELQEPAAGAGLKGHMPKVHMPSIKMPKVDLKGPQVDITGTKLDLKGAKGQADTPDMAVSLPSMEVDIQAPGAKVESDITLGDKEADARDSKFKMPKFKVPSFGVSAPIKDLGTSVDVPVPKVIREATLPSLGGDIRAPEGSVQLPSAEIELRREEVEVGLPEGDVRLVELKGKAEGARFKGHLPKVHMPSIKMPKVDIKSPQVDIKGPHGDITTPKLDVKGAKGEAAVPDVAVSLPSVEVDIQATGAMLEGDITLEDKEAAARDSKFKMPKFKMPSFGMSVPCKSTDISVDVSGPQVQADVHLPSFQTEVNASDLSINVPSTVVDIKTGELRMKLPEGHVPEGELQEPAAGAGLKGHLPKMHMPSIKMPKVDLKGPQVDITGPKVDLKGDRGQAAAPDVAVSLPSVEVDIQAPGTKMEGDITLGDKESAVRDSKFKMPKFKMPSFSQSTLNKDLGTSVDIPVPKVTGEATLPSLGGEIPAAEGSVQLPSAEIELPGGELEVGLPEGDVRLVELKGKAEGTRFKGHLPKVQVPGIKLPKVDLKGPQMDVKGPQVDITGPKLDLKGAKDQAAAPDMAVSLPSVEVDIKAPDAKVEGDIALGDKEAAARDSKFKMPKFKMPSFGVSAPSKDLGTSVDVPVTKVTGEATLPSLGVEIRAPEGSVQLLSAEIKLPREEVEVGLPEGDVRLGEWKGKAEGARFKGHLPKVQMPGIKMPKVDFKGPQVDIKGPHGDITGPKMDLKGAKGEVATPDVAVSLPSVEVDIQAPGSKVEDDIALGDKEAGTRDSKFKMPKFKMPSFGMSAPSKSTDSSVVVSRPQVQAEVRLPSFQVDVKTSDLSIDLPSTDMDVKSGELGVKLPEGHMPKGELQEPAAGAGLKGHLPKVHMPSIKMPKVDLKGPQVDITGPKLDLKGAKGQEAAPDMAVSLPSVEVDIQAPGTKLEGDIALGDKEADARDSKFKMPKFKMPSFGVSAPSKDLGTSVDVPVPKVTGEATLPSLGVDIRAPEGSVQLPSAEIELPREEVEVGLPEGDVRLVELKGKAEGARFKGHLPKVQMTGIKMPKVDFKGPQVDIKGAHVDILGPKLDLKGAKGEVASPDMTVSLPSVVVDIQAPGSKLEGDIALGDKEAAARDSKFKMPKFKMPSFGMSAPSKSTDSSVVVSGPQVQAEVRLPSFQVDVKTSDLSIDLPSADVDVKTSQLGVKLPEGHVPEGELQEPAARAGLKGHLPKVHMPSIKMPKVDLKGPQVDISGPKLDLKVAKGEVAAPDVAVSLPSMEVDIQAPGSKLEGDIALGEKEAAARDSKFKMPKFKMPSFGMSVPSKDLGTSVDVPVPKVTGEATLPRLSSEIGDPEGSVQQPSAEIELPGGEVEVGLPEGDVRLVERKGKAEGARFKGHLPKVQMPSIKMPKVDIKGPHVDITGPKLDLKGPKGEVAAPDVAVSLPSMEVDIQAPGAKLEDDIVLGDKGVPPRNIKFRMPKVSMPFSRSTSSRSSVVSKQVQSVDSALDVPDSLEPLDPNVGLSDMSDSTVDFDGGLSIERGGEKSKIKKFHFKMPKVFSPPGKSSKSLVGLHADSECTLPTSGSATPLEIGGGVPLGEHAPSREPSMEASRVGWPRVTSGTLDLSRPHAESCTLPSCESVTLTKYQVTLPTATISPELPPLTLSESQGDAHISSNECTADLPPWDRLTLSQTDSHPGLVGPLVSTSYGRVTFPKFHGPKFVFSAPEAGDLEGAPRAVGVALCPPSPVWGVDSSAKEATVFPEPGAPLPSAGVSMLEGTEDPAGTAQMAATAVGGSPAADADCEGKGSPLKMPRLKLPSFRRSPKKATDPTGHPGHSLAVDVGPKGSLPGLPVPQVEAYLDTERGSVKTPGFAVPKLAAPKMRAPTGGAGLPQGDPDPTLSSSPAEDASQATLRASGEGAVEGTGAMVGPREGVSVDLHLPQVHLRSVDFFQPDLRPTEVQVEVSQSAGELPLPKHSISLGDGSKEHGLRDGSASHPWGEVMDPSTEDPLQASSRTADAAAPTVGSAEGDAAAGDVKVGSQESWFRMPSLRLPSLWRSSRERGAAQVPVPAASAPKQADAPATVRSQGVRVPGSETETIVSSQPPEAEADVLRRTLDSKGLNLHRPPAGMSSGDLPTSEAQLHLGQGSLPLQMPSRRLSETKAPPGETGKTPPRGSERTEHQSSPTKGPLRLKASRIDVPSQIPIVDMGQLWEDSVLTVKFPTLKVPRFTFPAPGSTADVFIPTVREVWCPDSSLDLALHKESSGDWGASILKTGAGVPREQPVVLDLSSEASPISKVRVHIQGARVESQEVTTHSRVTAESADLSGPETFSTQIVRESEIPASKIQMPSYGFSLLKGKVPERPSRAQVHVVTQDSGLPEGLQEAPQQVTPGADPSSGDLQPDTGEPFEMISSSLNVLGPQTFTYEVRSGYQFADSCSDEEPVEILEFLPEDDREVATPLEDEDKEATEKPESKRSGLFRFWLPNIGFSSSTEETSAGATEDVPRPAPVQTQPEARPGVELPKKQEKAGWFRFPKLGFSSSPTKKSQSTEDRVGLAEPQLQEEAVTFFDAQESFSPEEEDGEPAEAAATGPGPRAMVTSAARTELVLLEQGRKASDEPTPRPTTK
ncbi:protein AHNAK2 isoform 2-T3 [Hipposideros larvatus]